MSCRWLPQKKESDSVTFQCLVEGAQGNSTWMRKQTGQMVGDGPLLQLHNLLQNDSDMYCCVVELSRSIVMRHCGVLTVGK